MNWRWLCIWSSFLLLPMVAILLAGRSILGLIYAASAVVAYLYHRSAEKDWITTDHTLAYTAIAANFWLAYKTNSYLLTGIGVVCVLMAIRSYFMAKKSDYDKHHTIWHVWCGTAGIFLALGYI